MCIDGGEKDQSRSDWERGKGSVAKRLGEGRWRPSASIGRGGQVLHTWNSRPTLPRQAPPYSCHGPRGFAFLTLLV